MKNTSQRREEILTKLKVEGSVTVLELSKQFDVSTVTIRNDLAYLEKQGTLMRSYGGAITKKSPVPERSIEAKNLLNADQKNRIAQHAASLVQEGDAIILDSGTTTQRIAYFLNNTKNVTVMTNGLNVADALAELDDVEVMMTGGTMRKKSLSFYGEQAEENLKAFHFDKLFLGVDGFHLKKGISTHSENEARLNRMMCKVANQIIVVTDSSKFNRMSLHKIIPPADISTLITDSGIPEEYKQELIRLGIEVVLV